MQVQDYLKHGLVAGTLVVIAEYIQKVMYYQNDVPYNHSTGLMLWQYLAILILAGGSYWAVSEARRENPLLKFGQAFFVSIYVVFIASLLVGGFYFLYARYIDPTEVDRLVAYWSDKMKADKVNDADIRTKMDQFRMGYTASSQFLLGLKYLVYGLFTSLVIAAFTTRKRQMLEAQS
jgi:hypothetical protein